MNILKGAPPLNSQKEYRPAVITGATYNSHIFAQKDFHMARQFFVRRVCRYGLSAIDAFTMIKQVKNVSGNNEKLWVSDLVELKLYIKLMDLDRDWAIENMYDEDVELK